MRSGPLSGASRVVYPRPLPRLDSPYGHDLLRARRSVAGHPSGRGARRLREGRHRARRPNRPQLRIGGRLPARCASGSRRGTASMPRRSSSRRARCSVSASSCGHLFADGGRALVEAPSYDRTILVLRDLGRRGRRRADGRRGSRSRPPRDDSRQGAAPRAPLHDPDLPEPFRPDALARAAARARRARSGRQGCSSSRTIRTGSCASRGRRCRASTSWPAARASCIASSFSKTGAPGLRVGY